MSWPVEIFLALRYLRPRRTFVSAITVLSVLGVTLGVMVLIVVLSVMEGFEQQLQNKVIGFTAHMTVGNGEILHNTQGILDQLKKQPEVLAASPFVQGPVLVEHAGKISTPIIKGVPLDGEDAVLPLRKFIVDGEYELRGDSVLVGREWAKRNFAFVGDKILVYGPQHLETLRTARNGGQGVTILPTELTIMGTFSTGMFDYDLNFLIASMETVQRLYKLGDGVHGISVRVKDPIKVEALSHRLNNTWQSDPQNGSLLSRTWMDQNRPLFNAIATERVVMSFILFFIMIVAAFGLCSTLITITVQKSREIGLLKAMGARENQVTAIFALHGLIVGLIGASIGVGAALFVLAYRNPFRLFLDRQFGLQVFAADIYNFSDIPAVIHPETVFLIGLAAVVICVAAALIPARMAAELQPASALRYE